MNGIERRLRTLESVKIEKRGPSIIVYETPMGMSDEDARSFLVSEVGHIPPLALVVHLNRFGDAEPPRIVSYTPAGSAH